MLRLIFFSLFVISCAPEKVQKSKTYVSFGAAGTTPLFPGGALLVGRNLTTGHSFSVNAASGGAKFDLTNGSWEFAAIGWDDRQRPMTGTMKCARTERPIALDGQDTDVTLSLTQATCRESEVFGGAALYDASGKQKNVYVHTCEDGDRFLQDPKATPSFLAQDLVDNHGTCEGSMGAEKSFRVKFMFFNERIRSAVAANTTKIDPTTSPTTNATSTYENKNTANFSFEEGFNGSLASACINTSRHQTGSVKVGAGVSLPIFEPGVNLPYIVEAFENEDCSGNKLSFFFPNGLIDKSIGMRGIGTIVPSGPNEGFNLFVDSNKKFDPCAIDGAKKANTFAGVSKISYDRDRPNIICTPEQFFKLKESTLDNYNKAINSAASDSNLDIPEFIIARSLNFSIVSNQPVISNFVGKIDGAGFTLSGLTSSNNKSALIDSARWISVKNLHIDDFDISGAAASIPTAAFVGKIYSTASPSLPESLKSDITFKNITLSDVSVTQSTEQSGGVGSLIGQIDLSTNGTSVDISNIHVNFTSRNSISGPEYVGGLIGKVASHYKINISDITISGPIVDENFNADQITNSASLSDVISGSTNIGGVIGSSDNVKMGPQIKVQGLAIEGNKNVGGVVGLAHNTEVFGNTVAAVKLELPNNPNNPTAFGGVIGSLSREDKNDARSYIGHNIVNNFIINNPSDLSNVGGVLGEYLLGILSSGVYSCSGSGSPSLIIQNNHIKNLNLILSGNKIGGVAGSIDTSCSSTHVKVTSNLVNNASIQPADTNLTTVGGLIGKATNVQTIKYNLIQNSALGSISEPAKTITGGGLIGEVDSPSDAITINSNVVKDLSLGLTSNSDSESIFSAHFIGKLNSSAQLTFDGNALYGQQAKFSAVSAFYDCNSSITKCPIWIGNLNLTNDSNGDNYVSTNLMGVYLNQVSASKNLSIANPTHDDPTWFNQTSGDPLGTLALVPSFLLKWSQMAGDNSDIQVAGNFVDPFQITEGSQWDSIGDDAFLMSKSFKIMNDITVENSIASSANPFMGTLISETDTGTVSGTVSGTDTGTVYGTGLIQNVGSSENSSSRVIIGTLKNPLYVTNLNINSDSTGSEGSIGYPTGLVIGTAHNADICVRASGSVKSLSNYYTGGLVGSATNSTIKASQFHGSITLDVDDFGGLVGLLSNSKILYSSAIINLTSSQNQNFGGLVGQLNAGGHNEIRNNSVIFNLDTEPASSLEDWANNVDAIVGSYNTSTSNADIKRNIIDTRRMTQNNESLTQNIIPDVNYSENIILKNNSSIELPENFEANQFSEISNIDALKRNFGWAIRTIEKEVNGQKIKVMLPYFEDPNLGDEEKADIESKI